MAELRELKADVGVFAWAIGSALAPWKLPALALLTRLTLITAGRQLGKSLSMAVLALWWAFRKREQHVLIISASDHAARRLLAEVRRLAHGSELLRGSVVDDQAGLLRLTNGSVIRCVAASEAAVRGWSVDLLLIDEAALLPAELITGAALPTTSARPDARVVLASSATVAAGPFFDMFRAGEVGAEHIRSFRWVSRAAGGEDDAPWIAASAIEVDRAAMSGVRFAAEHQAEFAGGGDSLFTLASLAKVTVDYQPDELGGMVGPARVMAGVDWGASVDKSAFCAIGRLPVPGRRIWGVRCSHAWPAGHPLPQVYGEIAAGPGAYWYMGSEVNGLGIACTQELFGALERRAFTVGGGRVRQGLVMVNERPWLAAPERKPKRRGPYAGFVTHRIPVTTSAASKAATWSAIRLLVDKGELLIPASATDLIRELQLLRVDLTQGGVERIEASVGHDDRADSLYLSAIPFRNAGDPGWRCALARLADERRGLPEVPVPPVVAASPHVEGPDGLLIPQRPCWQSVEGPELTVPQGLDFAPPVDPALREVRERVQRALADGVNNEQKETVSDAGR